MSVKAVVASINKPARVAATAGVRVEAEGATWDEVVDAGLRALGESRTSLFGFGIERYNKRADHLTKVFTGVYTVYAYRD